MTTPAPQPPDADRHLLYLVVFDPEDGTAPSETSPVIDAPLDEHDQCAIPHALARDLVRALPEFWCSLRLPQSLRDLVARE
ncbi:hypothetical protein ACM9HC_33245, partial [Streptomyces sp. JAC18]|uniref:hypothetical protein n=1 Tax=Streptomyces sp. JAC18 TaxID=3418414 RepID=UPI003D81777F